MKKQWAVWTGEYDNDAADWYADHNTALDAWHALGKELGEGESAYMQRFDEDGDPDEDYAHELRRDDTGLLEYLGGERMWA